MALHQHATGSQAVSTHLRVVCLDALPAAEACHCLIIRQPGSMSLLKPERDSQLQHMMRSCQAGEPMMSVCTLLEQLQDAMAFDM
jgi:hypothetical protein